MTSQTPRDLWSRLESLLNATQSMERLLRGVNAIGMIFFVVMMVMTFADVFMRYCFNRPFNGTVELTGLMMSLVVLLCTAYAQWTKTHIVMDIVTLRLNESNRLTLECITLLWSVATIWLSAWSMFEYGLSNAKTTPILGIPLAPFICLGAVGVLLLFAALLRDTLQSAVALARQASSARALTALGLGVLGVAVAWWFVTARLPGLDSIAVGFVGIITLFTLFFLGMPVAFALMATGLVFVGLLRGEPAAMTMFSKSWYNTVSNYTWSPLMSFMLMGYLCYYGRFGEDIYRTARAWMGHLRGGLAIGSVVACALFGAVVGDVLAGSIAMAAIALPEMRRNNYSDELAVGTLACSGTIGALIPPSTTFIIYGVLAEQSISDLFMAGVIPGLLCTLCFCVAIWVMVLFRPSMAPLLPKASPHERMASLKSGVPILTLFVLVIGGIYGGLFTPTEGGAIGACCTFLLALVLGRMSLKTFMSAMDESCRFTSMCFTLLGGATVLGYFMTMTRIPTWLATSIASMDVAPMLVMTVIVLVICFLGCFLPAIPLILICVPIFIPIAKVYQWNLIWFGVIIAILNNMASITPPFGISLFVMKGIAKVPLSTMFRASVPFIAALGVCLFLVVMFPSLSIWLPMLLKQ